MKARPLPMDSVSPEAREILDWILTEVGAGMCLVPKSDDEHTWNNAHERCKGIIQSYREGVGLFQMTRGAKSK